MEVSNKQIIAASLAILMGGNATGVLNAFNPHFRADGFTKLDAEDLKEDLRGEMHLHHDLDSEEMHELDSRLDLLEYKVDECRKKGVCK